MAEVIWSEPALAQLEAIASFIALDKPEAARAVVQRIFDVTDRLESFLRLGRKIPEFPQPNYRQVWISPCWIYYRVEGDVVCILHVRRAEHPLRKEELGVNEEA
ncbi:MAG TPA: type II toxin-antitoxin system RelE/ParE family toxin [Opitutaceae bacterium]